MSLHTVTLTHSSLSGKTTIPPSKSQTMRALLFAFLSRGTTSIQNLLPSPDTEAMIRALQLFGTEMIRTEKGVTIVGQGGKECVAEDVIDCGNSGQVLRFIGATAALYSTYTVLTGDRSIRSRRPIRPLLDGLEQLGCVAQSTRQNGFAPILIRGPLHGGRATVPGEDSQPISALLIAAALTTAPTILTVITPGETPWIDLTLHWLRRFHLPIEVKNYRHYRLVGNGSIPPFTYTVPGDFSSAAYPIAAALITHSELLVEGLDFEDPQGDKQLLTLWTEQGALFEIDRARGTLWVKKSPPLRGGRIDVAPFIDALPILAAMAPFATDSTELCNGAIARHKESNRIEAMGDELRKMGGIVDIREDGLCIEPSPLTGVPHLDSHSDHRIALALSVAALGARGKTTLHGAEAALKSYPHFFDTLFQLGVQVE